MSKPGSYAPAPCDVWELQQKWMTPEMEGIEDWEEITKHLNAGNRYYFLINGEVWIICVNRIDLGYLHFFKARHCHLRKIYTEMFPRQKYEGLDSQLGQIIDTVKRTWQLEET